MYKIVKARFLYRGMMYTFSQIRNMTGKAKRCRKLGLYYTESIVEFKGKTIKLFFSKQGKNGKWKTFVCTNTQLSFIQLIEIYQTRWTIEVFFKESKQILGLDQFQTREWTAWQHQMALNFLVSSFILKEKLLCFDDLPLLSARDIKQIFVIKLYKKMTEEQLIDKMFKRHLNWQRDINYSYQRI